MNVKTYLNIWAGHKGTFHAFHPWTKKQSIHKRMASANGISDGVWNLARLSVYEIDDAPECKHNPKSLNLCSSCSLWQMVHIPCVLSGMTCRERLLVHLLYAFLKECEWFALRQSQSTINSRYSGIYQPITVVTSLLRLQWRSVPRTRKPIPISP